MITGSGNFQTLFQGLLGEIVELDNEGARLLQVIKLSNDSIPIVQRISGSVNNGSDFSAFGELLVASVSPKTAWRFDYGVNTRLISTTGTANGGFVTGSASMAMLVTGENPSGTAAIQTRQLLRYIPGMGGLVRFTTVFNTGTPNSEQEVGVGDTQDGFFFGYNETEFGVLRRRAGVDDWIPQSGWNGERVDFSPTLGNIYQIRFQWLGFGNIYFSIFDRAKRRQVVVHTIEYPNTSTLTHILNPTLPLRARIRNKGNASNTILLSPSAIGAIEGAPESQYFNPLDVENSSDVSKTISDTNKNHVITIRNKAVFNGQANRVPVKINSIDISRSASGANTTAVRLYRNAATAGALSFVDVDTGNSPVDVSTTATTIVSTNAERSYALSTNITTRQVDFGGKGFILNPNESVSIEIQNSLAVGTDIFVTVNWSEEF